MSPTKYVYDFSEGNARMKSLLGGKGANLAEMTGLGIPVPPGFIVTTEACVHYSRNGSYPEGLERGDRGAPAGSREAHRQDAWAIRGTRSCSPSAPARSFSMPGMMDTVLNLGLNDETVEGLAKLTGNPRFAYDSYRRFIQHVRRRGHGGGPAGVRGRPHRPRRPRWAPSSTPISPPTTCATSPCASRRSWARQAGEQFPADPMQAAAHGHRGRVQELGQPPRQGLPPHAGHPRRSGHRRQRADHGVRQQGRDLRHRRGLHPRPLHRRELLLRRVPHERPGRGRGGRRARTPGRWRSWARSCPQALEQLYAIRETLEKHYRDMQDVEFTIEDRQALHAADPQRQAHRAGRPQMAVDMVAEGLITKDEALMRVDPASSTSCCTRASIPRPELRRPRHRPGRLARARRWAQVVFDADEAEERGSKGEPVILVRWETNPDDIHGLIQAQGVITSHGGMTSHAAVVARGMGKPCIAGAAGPQDRRRRPREFSRGRRRGQRGRLDHHGRRHRPGHPGPGRPGAAAASTRTSTRCSAGPTRSAAWACAPTPTPPRTPSKAREFGAEGIGLCRTEHMFMQQDRLPHVQAMIMADDHRGARAAPGQAAALPARGLRRHLPGHGRPAGDHPPARPAAARVPAQLHRGHGGAGAPAADRRPGRGDRRAGGAGRQGQVPGRGQPHAGHPRLPPGHPVAGDLRHAGAGHHRGGLPTCWPTTGKHAARGDHDPAGGLRRGAQAHARADRRDGRRGAGRARASRSTTPSAP